MNGYEDIQHVLAIGAHPDDIEILCGGTLARFAGDGKKITVMTVMNGDKGTFDVPAQELAQRRKQECIAAAALVGAEWTGLGIPDGTVIRNADLHVRMIQAVQAIDPDMIITHAPNDYMSDHTEVSKMVADATFYTVCPQFCAEDGRPCDKVVPVYFMDTVCGIEFAPEDYVDITDTLAMKLDMYSKHESQHTYLSQREGLDFFDVIQTVAHFRGLQCGVKYAEAFRRYAVWPRISCARLLPS